MKRIWLLGSLAFFLAAPRVSGADLPGGARVLFYLPFENELTAITPARELEPEAGVDVVDDLSQSVTIGELARGKQIVVGDKQISGGDSRIAYEDGLRGRSVRLRTRLTYAAPWLKEQPEGTITLWYRNPNWRVTTWNVPAMLTTAQPDRAKTSAFQTPISWWIFNRLTAPPEQGNSRWYHWTIEFDEHPRNISPREKDDDRWHFWALRWNRAAGLLEVIDDGQVRDISRYANRLEPGRDFWLETYRGHTTQVYEDVGHIKFEEVFLGSLHLARFCEVGLDEIFVLDKALSREELAAACRRGLQGQPTWPAEAVPKPAQRLSEGLDLAALDPARPGLPAEVDWSSQGAVAERSATQEKVCLNGYWRFQPVADRFTRPDPQQWSYVRLPGLWGEKSYLLDPAKLRARANWNGKPLAGYELVWLEREVEVPANQAGRRFFLSFDRVDEDLTRFDLYINGRFVRRFRNYGPGRTDITGWIQPGQRNRLLLGVEKKDRFLFDLYLESRQLTKVSVHDPYVVSEYRKKAVTVQFDLENHTDQPQTYTYGVEFCEWPSGRQVHTLKGATLTIGPKRSEVASVSGPWPNPHCWSIYDPFLHTARVLVRDGRGRTLDTGLPVRFGYRELWSENGWLFLNGVKMQIRGIGQPHGNIGYDNPIDYSDMNRLAVQYITAMKKVNQYWKREINWYGCDSFLEAADRMGFFVTLRMSGTGFQAETFWAGNPSSQQKALATARWLRNHPSVASFIVRQSGNYAQTDTTPYGETAFWWENFKEDASWDAYHRVWEEFVAPLRETSPSILFSGMWLPYGQDLGPSGTKFGYGVSLQSREEMPRFWSGRGLARYHAEEGWPQISRYSWDATGQDDLSKYYELYWPNMSQVTEELAAMYFGDLPYDQAASSGNGFGSLWKKDSDGQGRFSWEYVSKNQVVGLPYSRKFTGPFETPGYVKLRSLFPHNTIRSWRWYGYGYWEHTESGVYFEDSWNFLNKEPEKFTRTLDNIRRRPGLFIDKARSDTRLVADYATLAGASIPLSEVGAVAEKVTRPLAAFVLGWPDSVRKDHAFYAGELIRKQVGILNEYPGPLAGEVRWNFQERENGRPVYQGVIPLDFRNGDNQCVGIEFRAPAVKAKTRYRLCLDTLRREASGRLASVHDDAFDIEVFPPRSAPAISGKIGLIDTGAAGSLFQIAGIPFAPVTEKSNLAEYDLLVIGRGRTSEATRALLKKLELPKHLAAGLNLLVLEQEGEVLERTGQEDWPRRAWKERGDRPELLSFGLRQERQSFRNVFIRVPGHRLFVGLSDEDFANWRGASNLIPPYTKEYWYRAESGRSRRNANASNFGDVVTYALEKPQGGNFVSLVDAGFDLLQSALLEEIRPHGRTLYCQLNVSNRYGVDPAATLLVDRLVAYALEKPAPLVGRAVRLAGAGWDRVLAGLPFDLAAAGSNLSASDLKNYNLLVAGIGRPRIEVFDDKNKFAGQEAVPGRPGQDPVLDWLGRNRREVADFVEKGGAVLVLPVQSAAELEWLPFELKLEPVKFFAAAPGDFFASGAIGPADLYYRRALELPVPAGLPAGSRSTRPAILARVPYGRGEFIFAQLHPKSISGNWAESKLARVLSTILTERGVADRLDLDPLGRGYGPGGYPYQVGTPVYFDPYLSTDW